MAAVGQANSAGGGTEGSLGNGSAPSSSTKPVAEWENDEVATWLASLNLSSLAPSFEEQGIMGDVLVQLDNDALKDLGVDSVGQRLALLGGIYKLKEQWGVEIDQGDYRPQSEDIPSSGASASSGVEFLNMTDPSSTSPVTVAQLVACLKQRDERIIRLEHELRRTTVFLAKFQYDFTGVCRYQGLRAPTTDYAFQPFVPGAPGSLSLPGPGRKLSAAGGGMTSPHVTGMPIPSPANSLASLPRTTAPGTYESQHDDAEERIRTPTSSNGILDAGEPPVSPAGQGMMSSSLGSGGVAAGGNGLVSLDGYASSDGAPPRSPAKAPSTGGASTPTSGTHPPWMRATTPNTGASTSSSAGGSLGASRMRGPASPPPKHAGRSSPTSAANKLAAATSAGPSTSGTSAGPSSSRSALTPATAASNNSSTTPASSSSTASRDFVGTATTLGTGDNPYKSFRVTLEDPCYKVLPAALKKYKINDDWRLYALFICYGTTERCLSYDEKPLLLFQKLKEARQNPVFMLRHIRDVKSPITIANAKAAARRGSAADKPVVASSSKAPASRMVSSSEAAAWHAPAASMGSDVLLTGPAAQLPKAPTDSRTYAIAIYPYVCERDDEFDVSVGDTFVVLSKAKGWWVVQSDGDATGQGDVKDGASNGASALEIKSGWVPAGCLIETSRPLAPVFAEGEEGDTISSPPTAAEKSSAPIPPQLITSTSTPGVMLMDYSSAQTATAIASASAKDGAAANGSAADNGDAAAAVSPAPREVELKRDDRLRVFKRYNHWSYCVQEAAPHARLWVPSWFISKPSSSSSSSSGAAAAASAGSSGSSTLKGSMSVAGGSTDVDGGGSVGAGAGATTTDDGLAGVMR